VLVFLTVCEKRPRTREHPEPLSMLLFLLPLFLDASKSFRISPDHFGALLFCGGFAP